MTMSYIIQHLWGSVCYTESESVHQAVVHLVIKALITPEKSTE